MRKVGKILLTAGFSFFLFLHHPHKRLENISIFFFYFPLFSSATKRLFLGRRNVKENLPCPLLVTAKLRQWEHEVDHLSPSSAEVKNKWSYPS